MVNVVEFYSGGVSITEFLSLPPEARDALARRIDLRNQQNKR